jgi:hypothetical protein
MEAGGRRFFPNLLILSLFSVFHCKQNHEDKKKGLFSLDMSARTYTFSERLSLANYGNCKLTSDGRMGSHDCRYDLLCQSVFFLTVTLVFTSGS